MKELIEAYYTGIQLEIGLLYSMYLKLLSCFLMSVILILYVRDNKIKYGTTILVIAFAFMPFFWTLEIPFIGQIHDYLFGGN